MFFLSIFRGSCVSREARKRKRKEEILKAFKELGLNRRYDARPYQRPHKRMRRKYSYVDNKRRKKNERRRKRQARLRANTASLYHETSEENAKKILKSGRMYRGILGWAGGGIYFATSKDAAHTKSRNNGVMLSATVLLGNVKHVAGSESDISTIHFRSLIREGFDSVCIDPAQEYVVYNCDQVENIKRA